MKKIIGLTGDIAAGKSTVSQYLLKKGYSVIDADLIARKVVEPGSKGLQYIAEQFGQEYISQQGLDRKALGKLVFQNEEALQILNAITWPLITEEVLIQIEKQEGILFLDAALLYESKMDELCDMVWLITAESEIRLKRLMLRDHIEKEEAQKKMQSQKSTIQKELLAERVFYNNSTPETLIDQVKKALLEIGNPIEFLK